MKASINSSVVRIKAKLSEEKKVQSIVDQMLLEFNSMVIIESHGADDGAEMVEFSLCYSTSEATVKTVKESYADAKKATK